MCSPQASAHHLADMRRLSTAAAADPACSRCAWILDLLSGMQRQVCTCHKPFGHKCVRAQADTMTCIRLATSNQAPQHFVPGSMLQMHEHIRWILLSIVGRAQRPPCFNRGTMLHAISGRMSKK